MIHLLCYRQIVILLQREVELQQESEDALRKPDKFAPNSNYKEKYQHLIGLDAALDAAKKTETNKQYGFGENFVTEYYYKLRLIKQLNRLTMLWGKETNTVLCAEGFSAYIYHWMVNLYFILNQ